MARHVAFLFPGQGAQTVGMGYDLYQRYASVRDAYAEADDVLGYSISQLCFEGPESELKRTINTQPAILATSYACLQAAWETGALSPLDEPALVAGHSLGEYTALIASGALSYSDGLRLVRERARLMEEACAQQPGSMAAVLGMDEATLATICDETGVEMANINAPDQIVISGEVNALSNAMEHAKERGARRVIQLEVGGAFHSRLMRPASDGIEQAVATVALRDAHTPVVANSTGLPVVTASEVQQELLWQLCAPVRWQATIEFMAGEGVTTYIELGPGKVLTGLVKRMQRDSLVRNINDLASLNESKAA